MSNPNGTKFTVKLASTQGGHIPNLHYIPQAVPKIQVSKIFFWFFFFFVILHTFEKLHNLQMCILIQLKFGASFIGPKANICYYFTVNLINIHGILRCFMCKAKWKFCYTYRENCLLKQDKKLN